jgi:hypothetical protein
MQVIVCRVRGYIRYLGPTGVFWKHETNGHHAIRLYLVGMRGSRLIVFYHLKTRDQTSVQGVGVCL